MLRDVARQKGRDGLILGHRVAPTVHECLNIGCDVETWAKRGDADFLAPMDFLVNDLNLRTDEFLKALEAGLPGATEVLRATGQTPRELLVAAEKLGLDKEAEFIKMFCDA